MCRYRGFSGSGSINEAEYRFRVGLGGPLIDFLEDVFAGAFKARRMLIPVRTFDIRKLIKS
jgi:hypothetical protein